jgi:hypothetical protein
MEKVGKARRRWKVSEVFECDNCGKKFDAAMALNLRMNCDKCKDNICAYNIDAAELIVNLQRQLAEAQARARELEAQENEMCSICNVQIEGFFKDCNDCPISDIKKK